jgi:hypothetical protein
MEFWDCWIIAEGENLKGYLHFDLSFPSPTPFRKYEIQVHRWIQIKQLVVLGRHKLK